MREQKVKGDIKPITKLMSPSSWDGHIAGWSSFHDVMAERIESWTGQVAGMKGSCRIWRSVGSNEESQAGRGGAVAYKCHISTSG